MKQKYILLSLLLFFFFFLFSITSLALIPGDFGSAGGGPPDGVVDFEDLMIFAMAYGSTPADDNWNPLCDIYPDGVIDFEDLMIFAMHYGERDVVSDIEVSTIIYQSSMSKLIDTKIKLEEGKLQPTYYFNEIKEIQKGVTGYAIYVGWHGYPNATGYRIYRSVNGGNYSIILDEEISGYTWYGRYDHDVSPGNTYSYYVTAYGSDWETEPSEIITRDTWLPPCSLISPTDQTITTDSNPTFTWNPVGLTNFPYESTIYSGESDLWIYDDTAEEKVWHPYFYDMTTSTIVYDTDGQATPLVAGHSYLWQSSGYGFDNNGHLIAMSFSDNWDFIYSGGTPAGITEVYAKAKTYNSSRMLKIMLNELEKDKASSVYYFNEPKESKEAEINHLITLYWSAYCETTGCGYRIYRSINEGEYEIVFSQDAPTGYDWYRWNDNEAGPGSTYSYYITAYGSDWETAPSEIVTIDIWLPPCSLVSPADQAIITESNPTFTWNPTGLTVSDLPYGSIISGDSRLWVYDNTAEEEVWYVRFEDDLITSTITYNNDEQAAPLTAGHSYYWEYSAYGYDENGNQIAASSSGGRDFIYSGGMPAGITEVIATAKTYNSSRMPRTMLNELEKDKASSAYYFNELEEYKGTGTEHSISLSWSAYCETTGCGYRIYRKINEGGYEIVFSQEAPTGYDWYRWDDNEAGPGSTYSYYITAYGPDWETDASEIVTIDTWLPPCSQASPADEFIITDPNPTFTWNPVGLNTSDFPYGSITFGSSELWVYDDTAEQEVWNIRFEDDMTISTITYNDDGQATPLTASHSYYWTSNAYGYDEDGNRIAASYSGGRDFVYSGGMPAGITKVYARAETYNSSRMLKTMLNELEKDKASSVYYFNESEESKDIGINYSISLDWSAYCETTGCGYRIYRKINEGDYEIVFSQVAPTGYDWYYWYDNEAGPGSTYSYYVTAYGPDWETDASEIVTIDTWLPPCSLISPADESIITDSNPTFTWNPVGLSVSDLPYGSITSGYSRLWVRDNTAEEEVWYIRFEDDLTTSTITYNDDGQATPLTASHSYYWEYSVNGYDENGNCIAASYSGCWDFVYSGGALAGITKVYARAETYNSSRMPKTMLNELKKDKASSVYYFNEPEESKDTGINYSISLDWSAYCETTGCGYRVYRKINGGEYEIVFSQVAPTGYDWYYWYDNEAGPGSTYSYYVTAYGPDWETDASEIITIDTWLPICSLISPTDESIVTDSNPTFTWNPVGLATSDLPYGSITTGDTRFWVYDDTIEEEVWYIRFEDDLITSTISYNDDGQATPLTASHSYYWNSRAYGYDENGNCIAASGNGDWKFVYSGGALAGITDVEAIARTRHLSSMSKCCLNELEKSRPGQGYFFNENNLLEKGEMNYSITLSWAAYCETTGCGYRVYRKINEGEYEIVFSQEVPTGYDWYEWEDSEAGPGSTYSYYVIAYGPDWETDPSKIVTRDTWLPPCTLNSPPDGTLTNTNPTFSWTSGVPDFPYGPICSGGTCMLVYDTDTNDLVWHICFDDPATSTATYGQDGQVTPLIHEHHYGWHSWGYGCDENGDWIATSESEEWYFTYIVNL